MAADARWPAMGTQAHVIVVGDDYLLELARRRIAELERRWSRFLPGSEVSCLNRAEGQPIRVSADTRLLVRRALEGWRLTGGLFDPTVLGDVVRAGYDRPFDRMPAPSKSQSKSQSAVRYARWTGDAADVVLDGSGAVQLPPGVGFDPGGIGKGLAADLVTAELLAAGARGACVNLGGDLRAVGEAPDGDAWRIGVDGPNGTGTLAQLVVLDGAVATSSRLRRRWRADGEDRHHLIDPRTGRPAATAVAMVTVVAGRAWQAEVLAKAAFLAGCDGFALLERLGAAALAVEADDAVHWTSTWPPFVRECAA